MPMPQPTISAHPALGAANALLAAANLPTADLTECRDAAPQPIQATREFSGICPASSTLMTKLL